MKRILIKNDNLIKRRNRIEMKYNKYHFTKKTYI